MTMSASNETLYADRIVAGQSLVTLLLHYAHQPSVVVLALPRGGVPVAYEVATALNVRLDVMLVRKLGVPSHEEYAMGAIASGGVKILNEGALHAYEVGASQLQEVLDREAGELQRREQVYRVGRAPLQLKDQTVILIDDGMATGATMMAAVHAVRTYSPARIVVAVPVAALEPLEVLRGEVNEVICPMVPQWLISVGYWYQNFPQVSDQDVIALLKRAWMREAQATL
ncbi:phosphoribosyltransferase family protein [Pseudomonas sp. GD03842]|uniref:phosphoribosyltransferase n=1 Tax=unclassified Pseudomonas TaxID=196821 RepID=UPI000D33EC1A|nr:MULTISPECIES: phosphoribosyltransferase family protein [unclassified Pseudomonas]MDH0747192.1 phosphoribosyltransferase family protein [Pseudomonas sp. GD03842]RAU42284.1 phosphoribosyltransferase [Pseudomonas sp. RIT 409]RAU55067.1 phosphoribosyltransferase [Pseudomonas sp. RIT 412]